MKLGDEDRISKTCSSGMQQLDHPQTFFAFFKAFSLGIQQFDLHLQTLIAVFRVSKIFPLGIPQGNHLQTFIAFSKTFSFGIQQFDHLQTLIVVFRNARIFSSGIRSLANLHIICENSPFSIRFAQIYLQHFVARAHSSSSL